MTKSTDEKKAFVLSVVIELSDFFPIKLTDNSKVLWVEELIIYSEDRILKAKKLLISSHSGFLVPKDFHAAITNFKTEKYDAIHDTVKNPVPMPDEFKKKFGLLKKEWSK